MFDHRHYVPILKWKQGEYQALFRLAAKVKDNITPLIEIPPIDWDHDTRSEAKTIDEHLVNFAPRFASKFNNRPAFIDLCFIDPAVRMKDDEHPLTALFETVREEDQTAIPVTGLDRDEDYQEAVRLVHDQDNQGVCLRISIWDIDESGFRQNIKELLEELEVTPYEVNLIIDLGSPNFRPIKIFTKAVIDWIQCIPHLTQWRTFTITSTAFPARPASSKYPTRKVARSEWALYQRLVDNSAQLPRIPTFGDYSVAHPEPFDTKAVDMRKIHARAKIRYTIDDAWLIITGKSVRIHTFDQYTFMCKTIGKSGHFPGPDFSKGDKYIDDCTVGGSTGNLTTWVWVDNNHHITKVVNDLANFYGA